MSTEVQVALPQKVRTYRLDLYIVVILVVAVLSTAAGSAKASPSASATSVSAQPPFTGRLVLSNVSPYPYANAADNSELDVSGSLTVEAWAKYLGDYRSSQVIAYKRNAYILGFKYWSYTRCIDFEVWPDSGSTGGAVHCQNPPAYYAGWHHIAGVFRAETGEVRIYLDGSLFGGPYTFTKTIRNSSDILQVGYGLVGEIDELRISDVARYTGSTYSVPTTPFICDANTRALWHFDESQGATIFHDACGVDNVLVGYDGAHTEGVTLQYLFLPLILR